MPRCRSGHDDQKMVLTVSWDKNANSIYFDKQNGTFNCLNLEHLAKKLIKIRINNAMGVVTIVTLGSVMNDF
jgi:hypothetical protein